MALTETATRKAKARKLIANGADPIEVKREQKRASKAQSEHSFENIAREWHEQQKGRWTPKHAGNLLHSLEREIFQLIGHKPVHELTVPEILEAVRRLESGMP